MTSGTVTAQGVIHGKTINLDQEPGLPDGQQVTVTVKPVTGQEKLPPGEGIRRSAGAWADDAEELDKYLKWNRQQRKPPRRELEPSWSLIAATQAVARSR
jgi:hypothetical protein